MYLSQKQKMFSEFFLLFRNLHYILNILNKKTSLTADFFPKLCTPKNVVRYMTKKSRFRPPFDREHRKVAQTLLQSEPQQRYHIQ